MSGNITIYPSKPFLNVASMSLRRLVTKLGQVGRYRFLCLSVFVSDKGTCAVRIIGARQGPLSAGSWRLSSVSSSRRL